MTRFDQADWQNRRSEFNHQWLKNRLLSALDSAANVIKGRIRGAKYLDAIFSKEIAEWPERRRDLLTLLTDFETEMSPRRLFDTSPFSEWEPDIREVLSELLHQLWLIRYPIRRWISDALAAAEAVDKGYVELVNSDPVERNGAFDAQFAARFDVFREACRSLARNIETLPNQILVI